MESRLTRRRDLQLERGLKALERATVCKTEAGSDISLPSAPETPSEDAPGGEVSLGDVNLDGVLDLSDVVTLNDFLAGRLSSLGAGALNADVDGDGDITSRDLQYLLNYLYSAGPAPGSDSSPSPSVTASATTEPSAQPSTDPSASASPSLQPSASASPSLQPSASASPSASVSPSAEPSVQPSPSPSSAGDGSQLVVFLSTDEWIDTGANNSLIEDDSLFIDGVLGSDAVLLTDSEATNIHSHFQGLSPSPLPEYADWSTFFYTGKLRIANPSGGIGLTFRSDYPNSDTYYRIRRHEGGTFGGRFHFSEHASDLSVSGDLDSGFSPSANTWYSFRIQVVSSGTDRVLARFWPSAEAEPSEWQIDVSVSAETAIGAGTVGIWSMGPGTKYWSELAVDFEGAEVAPPAALESLSLTASTTQLADIGDSAALSVEGQYADGSVEDLSSQVQWTISDPSALSITGTGPVIAESLAEQAVVTLRASIGEISSNTIIFFLGTASPSSGDSCTSISVPRDRHKEIGTCYASGASCSSHATCTQHSRDYCIHGIQAGTSSTPCFDASDSSCIQDITFVLDKAYTCGQFVDGSWWVEADELQEVKILAVLSDQSAGCSPGGSGTCYNGIDIDQEPNTTSLTDAAGFIPFSAASPTFPYTASVSDGLPESVLKVINNRIGEESSSSRANRFLHAAVLTVTHPLSRPPFDAFRPPFNGPNRQSGYYRESELMLSRMPELSSSAAGSFATARSLAGVKRFFSTVHLGTNGRNNQVQGMMTLYQSYFGGAGSAGGVNGYHAARRNRTAEAILRLFLDDADYVNNPDHRAALLGAIQQGIDLSGLAKGWGGSARIKNQAVPTLMAAFLLNRPEIADTNFDSYVETDVHRRNVFGTAIWGYKYCSPAQYWQLVDTGEGNKWCGAPWNLIDSVVSPYQTCCSSKPNKGHALILRALEAEDSAAFASFMNVLDLTPFMEYIDRWVSFGYHTLPDACSVIPGYPEYGPGTDACIAIRGSNRHPERHGTAANSGSWGSSQVETLWNVFRSTLPEAP